MEMPKVLFELVEPEGIKGRTGWHFERGGQRIQQIRAGAGGRTGALGKQTLSF